MPIQYGNSLTSEDKFKNAKFDYMLSNPPFGKDWSDFAEDIQKESGKRDSRYHAGIPRKSDGSFLFLQHMLSKMHSKNSEKVSRLAIVFNGSPLFTGDAVSGESKIRRWILEDDLLETIIGLPKDMFYNTGINTYIWILTNKKSSERQGKVQLINAVDMFARKKKSLGNKRNDITHYIEEIKEIYESFPKETEKSKIFRNEDFGYTRITVNRPLKRNYKFSDDRIESVKLLPSFQKLAKSTKKGTAKEKAESEGKKKQEQIISILQKQDKTIISKNYREFEKILKNIFYNAKINISDGLINEILNALSEYDDTSSPCLNAKNEYIPDPDLRDYEYVPLTENIDRYFKKEVLKYVPDAYFDPKDNKIGYEIPFTRHFYQYKKLRPLEEIDSEIKQFQKEISSGIGELIN